MPTRDVTAYWMPRLKRGMTIEGCASAFPRQDLPELLRRSPSKTRGRRECRVRAAPMAACASVESTRVSNQGHTAINRHSLRDGFNGLYRALPGDRALLPPSFADRSTTLASASGRQDHTSLPSADKPTRLVNRRVHRIPLPTSVTIAIRPSCGGGMGEKMLVICPTPQARFTATHWHDGQFAHGAHARIARRAKSVRSSRGSLVESSSLGKTRHHPRMRVSSTPCSLGLIAVVSGILDHPHSRAMTAESRMG